MRASEPLVEPRRRTRTAALLAALVLAGATACESTNRVAPGVEVAERLAAGSEAPGAPAATAPPSPGAGAGVSSDPATPDGGDGGSGGPAGEAAVRRPDAGPTTSGSQTAADPTPPPGPGGTDAPAGSAAPGGAEGSPSTASTRPDPIAIGFQYTEDVQAGFGAVGASGNPPSDREVSEALVAWLNANGGLAGRPVDPVYHATSITSGTAASHAQAACATFTQDHDVFAAISGPVTIGDDLAACMAAAGTPLVEINYWHFDEDYWDRLGGILYRPGRMRPERWAPAYVDGLVAQGFFGDGVTPNRVGLLRFDDPVYARISDRMIKPRLAEHGFELTTEIEITTPPSVASFSGMAAELQNAIVRLRSEGVTHVMFIENGAIMTYFFSQEAESQRYRPVYGLSSADTPSTLAAQAPPAQLEGAVGVGWQPGVDLNHPEYLDGQDNRALCARIMDEAGITRTYPSRGYYTLSRCDAVLFLKAALDRADELTPAGLRRATEALGTSYQSPFALETRLGPGRHDGASGVRPFAFDPSCTCFRYTGPLRPTQ